MRDRPEIIPAERVRPGSEELERLARAVRDGQVLLLPTDSCYILAADALSDEAVERVFRRKGRSRSNPIHLLVSDLGQIGRYAVESAESRWLARGLLPGLLTLVLPRRSILPGRLTAGLDTVGIRLPDDPTPREVSRAAGRPLTATSANPSGRPAPYRLEEALEGLGRQVQGIALAVDGGSRPAGRLSTLVAPTPLPPRILRPGSIPEEEILRLLRSVGDPP